MCGLLPFRQRAMTGGIRSSPTALHGRSRGTVISAFKAGTDFTGLTAEYGAPRNDLLRVLRAHTEAA